MPFIDLNFLCPEIVYTTDEELMFSLIYSFGMPIDSPTYYINENYGETDNQVKTQNDQIQTLSDISDVELNAFRLGRILAFTVLTSITILFAILFGAWAIAIYVIAIVVVSLMMLFIEAQAPESRRAMAIGFTLGLFEGGTAMAGPPIGPNFGWDIVLVYLLKGPKIFIKHVFIPEFSDGMIVEFMYLGLPTLVAGVHNMKVDKDPTGISQSIWIGMVFFFIIAGLGILFTNIFSE